MLLYFSFILEHLVISDSSFSLSKVQDFLTTALLSTQREIPRIAAEVIGFVLFFLCLCIIFFVNIVLATIGKNFFGAAPFLDRLAMDAFHCLETWVQSKYRNFSLSFLSVFCCVCAEAKLPRPLLLIWVLSIQMRKNGGDIRRFFFLKNLRNTHQLNLRDLLIARLI
jgi:hypothetical protein